MQDLRIVQVLFLEKKYEEAMLACEDALIRNQGQGSEYWKVFFRATAAAGKWERLFAFHTDLSPSTESEWGARADSLASALKAFGCGDDFPLFWSHLKESNFNKYLPVCELDRSLNEPSPGAMPLEETLPIGLETQHDLAICVATLAARYLFKKNPIEGAWLSTFIAQYVEPHLSRGNGDDLTGTLGYLRNIVCYSLQESPEWNRQVFEGAIVPATRKALEDGRWHFACTLEAHTSLGFAQQPTTEAHARACFESVRPYFESVPMGTPSMGTFGSPSPRKKPRVAFLADALTATSPMKVIADIITDAFNQGRANEWMPILVTIQGVVDDVEQYAKAVQVPIINLGAAFQAKKLGALQEFIEVLRSELLRHEVDVLIHFDIHNGLSTLLSRASLAPIQIYWSMGHYFSPRGPQWDALIANGASGERFREIDGQVWRMVASPVQDHPSGALGKTIQRDGVAIRNSLFSQYETVFASIGRAQKIDSDEFMDVLARILTAVPNSVFLWFGSEELASVQQRMKQRSIFDRCLFQGIQNITKYAYAIDIHLDSFPFPGGYTMLETMAASVPAVFMDSIEARRIGILGGIMAHVEGVVGDSKESRLVREAFRIERGRENLLFVARDSDEYVAHALRLAHDTHLRAKAGKACRKYFDTMKFDRTRGINSFFGHLFEIIEGKEKAMRCDDATGSTLSRPSTQPTNTTGNQKQ